MCALPMVLAGGGVPRHDSMWGPSLQSRAQGSHRPPEKQHLGQELASNRRALRRGPLPEQYSTRADSGRLRLRTAAGGRQSCAGAGRRCPPCFPPYTCLPQTAGGWQRPWAPGRPQCQLRGTQTPCRPGRRPHQLYLPRSVTWGQGGGGRGRGQSNSMRRRGTGSSPPGAPRSVGHSALACHWQTGGHR